MEKIRGNDIAMIFQDPLSSLNPVFTIGAQIAESILLHQKVSKKEAYEKALEMLKLTGIPRRKKELMSTHTNFRWNATTSNDRHRLVMSAKIINR